MEPVESSAQLLNPSPLVQTSVFRLRWFVLFQFCALSFSNAMQWITYAPISAMTIIEFGTTLTKINLMSMIYMILYIPFSFPSSWILDRLGLRKGLICGAFLNIVGAWLRYGGALSHNFTLAFIGQSFAGLAQAFILQTPPKIAGNWFADSERAKATSIGALANQLGIAFGFLISPVIATKSFSGLFLFQAILVTLILVMIAIGIRDKPIAPPSMSAQLPTMKTKAALVSLIRNRNYILLWFSYGIGVGAFYAVSTLLGQTLELYGYTEQESGLYGFLMTLSGMVAMLMAGIVGDRYRKYRILILIALIGTLASQIAFLLSLGRHAALILIACLSLGYFVSAIIPLSLEASVDSTFPAPEALTAGVVMTSPQIFGIIFIVSFGTLIEKSREAMGANGILAGFLAASVILMFFYRDTFSRERTVQVAIT